MTAKRRLGDVVCGLVSILLVSGDLELRGVTQMVSFSLQAELQEEALHGKGLGRFLQSSFGYQSYSAFWGAVQNQDEVVLHVDIVAIRQ